MPQALHEQTRAFIAGLSDADLAGYIAAGTSLYEPEAVAFAQAEFRRRELDPVLARQLQASAAEHETARVAQETQIAALPLKRRHKVLAFIGGFCWGSLLVLVLVIIAWSRFQKRGELRRAADLWRFFFYGLGTSFLIPVFVAVSMLRR